MTTKHSMSEIKEAVAYFDSQVGHYYLDSHTVRKIKEETEELIEAIVMEQGSERIIDECSDVLTVAYRTAVRKGFKGTPCDLFLQAYNKMKGRIERGERDYKNINF